MNKKRIEELKELEKFPAEKLRDDISELGLAIGEILIREREELKKAIKPLTSLIRKKDVPK